MEKNKVFTKNFISENWLVIIISNSSLYFQSVVEGYIRSYQECE